MKRGISSYPILGCCLFHLIRFIFSRPSDQHVRARVAIRLRLRSGDTNAVKASNLSFKLRSTCTQNVWISGTGNRTCIRNPDRRHLPNHLPLASHHRQFKYFSPPWTRVYTRHSRVSLCVTMGIIKTNFHYQITIALRVQPPKTRLGSRSLKKDKKMPYFQKRGVHPLALFPFFSSRVKIALVDPCCYVVPLPCLALRCRSSCLRWGHRSLVEHNLRRECQP